MSRVLVVQKQHRWDAKVQALVPKYDLSKAEEHGELVYLLSPSAAPFQSEGVLRDLNTGLADFDPDRDCLLLIGNPVLIGLTVALAASLCEGKSLRMLQWAGKSNCYVEVVVDDPLRARF